MNKKLSMGVAASGLAVVIGWPVVGDAAAQSPVPLHIATNSAQVCGGTMVVSYSEERLVGKEWTFAQDQVRVKAQVHGINGRYQPGGRWLDVPSTSGGEGRLRVSVLYVNERGVVFDKVRVAFAGSGVASSAKVPDWLCGVSAPGRRAGVGPTSSTTAAPRSTTAAPRTTAPSTTSSVPTSTTTTHSVPTSTPPTWTPTTTSSMPTSTTAVSVPTTTSTSSTSSSSSATVSDGPMVVGYRTVTPGAYCSPVGSVGVSAGRTYVCSGPGRARWRR